MPIEDILAELGAYADLELQKKSAPEPGQEPGSGCASLVLPALVALAGVVVVLVRLAARALSA